MHQASVERGSVSPTFGGHPMRRAPYCPRHGWAAIDRGEPYRDERGRVRKPLSASSINKTIKVLSWFLGLAVQYKRIAENAAAGKERLLIVKPKPPIHLDTAEQIEALLDAAAELDHDPGRLCCEREAIVATLIFAGFRAHELACMLERDIDLANVRIFVGRSKTPAGLREIRILPVLHDILAAHKARPQAGVLTRSPSRPGPADGASAATCASGSCARSSSAPTDFYGGSARRSEVFAAVEAEMAERFGPGDLEIARGKPRWQAEVDIARRRLLERGLLGRGAREGIWELTKAGAERAGGASDGLAPRTRGEASANRAGPARSEPLGVA